MRKKINIDGSLLAALEILYARHLIRQYLDKKYRNNKDSAKHLTCKDAYDTIRKDYNPNPIKAPGGTKKNGQKIGGQFVSPNSALGQSISEEENKSGGDPNDNSGSGSAQTTSNQSGSTVANASTQPQQTQAIQTAGSQPTRYLYTPQEMAQNTSRELLDARVKNGEYDITTVLPHKLTKHFYGTPAFIRNWNNGNYKTYFTIQREEVEKNLTEWVKKGDPIRFVDGSIRVIYQNKTPVGNAYVYDKNGKPTAHVPTRFVGIIIEQSGIHGYPMWETSAMRDMYEDYLKDEAVIAARLAAEAAKKKGTT